MKNKSLKINSLSPELAAAIALIGDKEPLFPISSFPDGLQKIINKISISQGINSEILCSAMLFAYGFAIGNHCTVSIFPSTSKLKPILYLLLITNSGSNKSAPLKIAMDFFYKKDKEANDQYNLKKKLYETSVKSKEKNQNELNETPPIRPQMIYKEATMEAICEGLASSPRGICQIRDEMIAFFRDLNKYRAGSDLENYLELWSQDPLIMNRVTKEAKANYNPFISLAGTTQPRRLSDVISDILTNGSGLFDRFLFTWIKTSEKAIYQHIDIQEYIEEYEKSLGKIFDYSEKNSAENINITFSPEALPILLEWLNVYNKSKVDNGDPTTASMYSKLDIQLQRISLILHFISWSCDNTEINQISKDTLLKAIAITEYYRYQSEEVLSLMKDPDPKAGLKPFQVRIYNELPSNFSTGDGVKIAKKHGMPLRSFHHFLANNPQIFRRIRHGIWDKV